MRIYIGNKEIAGYFIRLKEGFDKIGVKADLVFIVNNKFYNIKSTPLERYCQLLFTFFKTNKRPLLLPFMIPVVLLIGMLRVIILIRALFKYDVFILNSEPLFNFSELAVLKWFNKKIIFVFLGTESRPSYISGNLVQGKYYDGQNYLFEKCYKEVKEQHKKISRIEKYADYTINHPPTSLFHQKPFIAWCHIGFPNDEPINYSIQKPSSRIVKILHAPSNAVSKGSGIIEEIINKMRNEGLPVEFVKLENVPNEKVLDELAKCDFVVDELYSDIPIGGLGTEAAFAIKPVINGGYYSDQILDDYPENVIPPSCFCLPENIEFYIREYINDPNKRKKDAETLNNFVKDNWTSSAVASRYMKIINGNFPDEWVYNPDRLNYFLGYGIEKNKLRGFLKKYVAKFSDKALFLDDKPALKAKFLTYINEDDINA